MMGTRTDTPFVPAAGRLLDLEQTAALIRAGRVLSIAGVGRLLAALPPGRWIGGTIPYFMAPEGGATSRDKLFVTDVPCPGGEADIRLYDLSSLEQVCVDAPANGFSIIIIPAFSDIHSSFARNAPGYPDMYLKPLVGWISGVHLDDLGKTQPAVFHGGDALRTEDRAVVMHVPLPPEQFARVEIINLFAQGDGDAIRFLQKGFSAEECLINGRPANLADYLTARSADTRLPLVADYSGAQVNVSIKAVDAGARRVDFYAPVFDDVEYRIARPVADYLAAFEQALPGDCGDVAFCCNCILNYLYSELEGKHLGAMVGPMTFGEVAYQLLNQTLVYMTIEG